MADVNKIRACPESLSLFFLKFIYYLFLAVLGLRFCTRAFSSCGERAPLFIAMRGPLTIAASLVAEHRLQTRRLSSCGSRAQLLRGMWDLPRPGLEPVSPALAGGFSTTAPPGKPQNHFLKWWGSVESSAHSGPQGDKLQISAGSTQFKFSSLLCPKMFLNLRLYKTSQRIADN